MVKPSYFVSGPVDIPGCDCELLKRGVGMPELYSEGFVHRGDVRELQKLAVSGWEHFVYRIPNPSSICFHFIGCKILSALLKKTTGDII